MTLAPQHSWAKKVYSPHVEKGVVEFETQTDVLRDPSPAKDGSVKQQFELAYGLTDWWSTGAYAVYSKPGDRSSYAFTSTKWANIFVLPKPSSMSLDWGLYAEYIWAAPSQNTGDIIEGKLLVEERGEIWRNTLNLVFKQLLSSGAPTASFGYAWRTQYALNDMELAIEAYGAMGPIDQLLPASQQSHLVGPVVTFEPWDDVELELGWLMDVNAGPAYGDFKLNVEVEF